MYSLSTVHSAMRKVEKFKFPTHAKNDKNKGPAALKKQLWWVCTHLSGTFKRYKIKEGQIDTVNSPTVSTVYLPGSLGVKRGKCEDGRGKREEGRVQVLLMS